MKKIRFIAIAIFLGAIFLIQTPVFAQSPTQTDTDQMMMDDSTDAIVKDEMNSDYKEESSEMAENVDSFELFWPIVAGKTRGESWYFLKRLKEKVRGALIFGDAKDAEYNVFLATKRVVEAEKLINEDKSDVTLETLEEAKENMSKAQDKWEDVENTDTPVKHEINNKLDNLEKFLPSLISKTNNDEVKSSLTSLNETVVSFNASI